MNLQIEDVLRLNKLRKFGYDDNGKFRPFTSEEFFKISCELGFNQDNPGYRTSFNKFSKWLVRTLNVRTGLEIGSGPGYLLYCLNKLGLHTVGMDGNSYSQNYFKNKHPEYSNLYSMDPFFERDYGQVDVLISIEVFEHIDDTGLRSVFRKIREEIRPKFIVFSSTPYADPNEGWDIQWGHINMKPISEWDELFLESGFLASEMSIPITKWARLYVSRDLATQSKYKHLLKKQSWLARKLASY